MSSGNQYTVEAFLDYVRKRRKKNTLRMYTEGMRRFEEYYKKTGNEILEERRQDWISGNLFQKKRFAREIEKFHAWLIKERKYSPNSATYYCQGIRALFAYYEMNVKLSNDIDKRKMTTKDYVPRIDQYAKMLKVADNLRDKTIVSMGLTLAWRIGDFAKIKKDDLPDLDIETPIPFEALTEKEEVIAKSFLSDETVTLLKDYLPTLNESNPYLFQSNGKGYLDHTTLNRILRNLAEQAKLKIPKGKRLRFHCFRKRFLSECANLRIDHNIAKILTGKTVEAASLAYLSEVNHKAAFETIANRLRLTKKRPTAKTTQETTEIIKRLDQHERMLNIIAAINPDVVKRADEMLKNLGVTMTAEQFIKATFNEKLNMIAEAQEKREQEEYAKMIAENGNNNNH